ncbi:MAG: AraC family transcriptional regulator [Bacteroidales bacterium]|nr:AraC family transcriptional regulator [Bacteroidales bacterium]
MHQKKGIPVYGLNNFRRLGEKNLLFQVEVFDANRHFNVTYPHRHDFYEILYLSKGSGYHIIDSNKYAIVPPCIFFLSPGQAHRLELSSDIEGFIFLFTAEFYLLNHTNKNRLLEFPFFFSVSQNNPPLFIAGESDNDFLRALFIRGCHELAKEKISGEIVHSVLELLLLTCAGLYPEDLVPVQKGKGQIMVKNFLKLIEENYQKNLSIAEYAEMLAVTPNHLTQMVKQITGKTSIELLQDKLVVETKRLLVHSNLTVSEIADTMNFGDQSYFTKYFKNKTGFTPLQYRKKSLKTT